MNNAENPISAHPEPVADNGRQPSEDERRAALRRLGPLAVMTSAAVMSLLVSKRASAMSSPPQDPE